MGMDLRKYEFMFTIGERTFVISEQTTIGELDEAARSLSAAIGKIKGREETFLIAQQRLAEFMRQHHIFDLYIDKNMVREKRKPVK